MKNEKILIFSYYSNVAGACQAEWIDDKIEGLTKGHKRIALISSIYGNKSNLNIDHFRVPSISLFDLVFELNRIRLEGNFIILPIIIFLPLILLFGLFIDLLLIFATKGVGEGRWSWLISATIAGMILVLKFKPNKILSSGGPASAHLAGIIIAKIFSLPVIVELQDPLSGEGIGRNPESRNWLYKVENYIIDNANKTVYVTKAAKKNAKKHFGSKNIAYLYPGSKDFGFKNVHNKNRNEVLKIVHLGSLYSTRNFDSIIAAIDSMVLKGDISEKKIELINLGHVSKEERVKILAKNYVKIMSPIPRIEALEFASKCDILLLIQHIDNRSNVTIPYKTYDYLNLEKHILALLNSEELTKLITDHGHTSINITDIKKISKYLSNMINNNVKIGRASNLDYVEQSTRLVEMI